MAFTADEIANINNAALDDFIDKGKVWKQYVANKPMLAAFKETVTGFSGGKGDVSFAVSSGYGGGSLVGYTGDDQVSYYNPTGIKRAFFPWREHHIGIGVTQTELKIDGIDVIETGADQTTREVSGREEHALANLLQEKLDELGEDYAQSLDLLVHGDGSSDAKALAGIGSLILPAPAVGTTGSIGRVANVWWRNRARTAANGNIITSNAANGGALITAIQSEWRQLSRYKKGSTNVRIFAGSDWIDAYLTELRANGNYSMTGWNGQNNSDGAMNNPSFMGTKIEWDPTLDTLGLAKRAYFLDMSRTGLRLLAFNNQLMKKHNPARPYDRYMMYNAITTTAVMVAKQLNTSGVYDIS